MTIRAALKILKMSKKALTAKYGKTATSRVIDARLTLKEKGMNIGKYTRKKATQVGMAGKIKKPYASIKKPTKKEIKDIEYGDAMREGPSGMFRKRG